MKKKIIIEGRFISKFTVPQKYIKDLNSHYEKAKIHLTSYGPRLAGRLASELNIMTLIEKTKAFKYFVKCMGDHIKTSEDFSVCKPGPHHLDIKDGKLCFIMSQNVCHYVTPKVGDFYIFSASHQHCVMPFKTKKLKEVRRSMSFNFIVKENVVK